MELKNITLDMASSPKPPVRKLIILCDEHKKRGIICRNCPKPTEPPFSPCGRQC